MSRPHLASTIEHLAAEFINRESNRQSLITVTRVELGERSREVQIFVSIFPEGNAAAALQFLKRMQGDFSKFLHERIKAHAIPRPLFMQDPNIAGVEEVK